MNSAQLRSLEELRQYSQELAHRDVANDPAIRKLQRVKQAAWLFLLVCAFLFYYLIDKLLEALGMLI